MKKPEEYLDQYNVGWKADLTNFSSFKNSITSMLKQTQIDAYNKALEDSIKKLVAFGSKNTNEDSILKLKK